MTVLGIDPGPALSAYVVWNGELVLAHGELDNSGMLLWLADFNANHADSVHCVIEQIRGFGVLASDNLFDTCWWSGRFFEPAF